MRKAETFGKEERLYLKKDFDELIKANNFFVVRPLKIYWKEIKAHHKFPAKFGVSVPKKNFAKATDRNKIKRQLREAYRKNKDLIYNNARDNESILLLLAVYTSSAKVGYQKIEESLKAVMEKIVKR